MSIHWLIKHTESQTEKLCNSVDRNDVTSPLQVTEGLEYLQCPVFGTRKSQNIFMETRWNKWDYLFSSIRYVQLFLRSAVPTHPSSPTFVHSSTHLNSRTEKCTIFSLFILGKNRLTSDKKVPLFEFLSYYCRIWMKFDYFRQILEKYTNIKFPKNLSSGSRVVPWGTNGRTDITKPIA